MSYSRYGVLAFTLLVAGQSPAQSLSPTVQSLFGEWKVERLVGASTIVAGAKSEKAPLGTSVTISADLIKTYDRAGTCKPRNPSVTKVDTEAKLSDDFGTSGTGLYLPHGKLRSRMDYFDAGCAFALILGTNELLWSGGNGYIYLLRRK